MTIAGMAVDLSEHNNNGELQNLTAQDFLADGAEPGSGAVRCPPGSRIWMLPSSSLRPLGGVAVQALVRVAHADHAQTLVAADGSFRLRVIGQYLFAFVAGDVPGINSLDDAVDLQPHPVPQGAWIQLGFVHDGFGTMELSFNGQVVARRTGVAVTVPPVGPSGLAIGNEPDADGFTFVGDIDDVQIWRPDPHEMARQFVARPLDPAMAACWERFIGVLGEALAADPNYTAAWQDAVTASVQRMIGSLAASGGGADLDGFRAEYDELWRRGELQGPGMADLFSRYAAFLIDAGVDVDPDGVVDETLRAVFGPLLEDVEILDCDRPFSGLPVLLYNAAVTGDAAPGRRR